MKQVLVRKVSKEQYHALRDAGYQVRFVSGGVAENTDQELVENLEALDLLRQREKSLDRQVAISDLQLSILDQIQSRLEK